MLKDWAKVLLAAAVPIVLFGSITLASAFASSGPALLRPLPLPVEEGTRLTPKSRFSPAAQARRAEEHACGHDERGFVRLGEPKDGDWLAYHPEPGQTLREYRRARVNRRSRERQAIHLQALDDLPPGPRQMLLPALREYLAIYFDVEVAVLPEQAASGWDERREQYDAEVVARQLAGRVPKNSLALVGLTRSDAFVGDASFVFGFGLLRERSAVLSLHRFLDDPRLLLTRTLKLAVHELGHAFSIQHCVFYRCVMNGANTLAELDEAPLHACPVCRGKLQASLGFEPARRYQRLAAFYRKYRMVEEAAFAEARMRELK